MQNLHLILSYVVPVKSKVEISQNLVAFSEYMNFNSVFITAEHQHEDEHEEAEEGESYDHFDFMEMAEETDETLRNYDENNDGYIHYGEFYRNHKKTLDSASKTPGAGG